MSIDRKALLVHIRRNFALDWRGMHGAPHWGRVLDNWLRLAKLTGARVEVVELFAFLHDARRLDDGTDPAHGHRAADLALQLQGRTFEIESASLDLLVAACRGHSDGMTEADTTVQTCWDADRLDLGRVGKVPDPRRLCTPAARDRSLIEWAYRRSLGRPVRLLPKPRSD